MSSSLVPLKACHVDVLIPIKFIDTQSPPVGVVENLGEGVPTQVSSLSHNHTRSSKQVTIPGHGLPMRSSSLIVPFRRGLALLKLYNCSSRKFQNSTQRPPAS
ncbi:hypothetical protein TNCV_4014761 [Trichonephila clavipes]|uniref:Uncharacterized protein n=1 Tax=Trichonephila clavipes TaxID=2585209 RepID=A0A8X6V2L8_TRICX|nr:hypothetical protein TNCV_4014761 [Trichonephila clavipes]